MNEIRLREVKPTPASEWDWKHELIKGFPWDDCEPDDGLKRSRACEEAGLLVSIDTEPGSFEEYEYGRTVYRLTEEGKAKLSAWGE